ncbi:MAG: 4a-hydroxytetrahydrobiopterin dehydratase [Candidatus Dojkabacteria bacterium]
MEYPKGWKEEESFLVKVFEFNNFVEAVDFVNKIVPLAEDMGHHPDLETFSYKKVRVKLTTHDEGNKITEKDTELAEKIEKITL